MSCTLGRGLNSEGDNQLDPLVTREAGSGARPFRVQSSRGLDGHSRKDAADQNGWFDKVFLGQCVVKCVRAVRFVVISRFPSQSIRRLNIIP